MAVKRYSGIVRTGNPDFSSCGNQSRSLIQPYTGLFKLHQYTGRKRFYYLSAPLLQGRYIDSCRIYTEPGLRRRFYFPVQLRSMEQRFHGNTTAPQARSSDGSFFNNGNGFSQPRCGKCRRITARSRAYNDKIITIVHTAFSD